MCGVSSVIILIIKLSIMSRANDIVVATSDSKVVERDTFLDMLIIGRRSLLLSGIREKETTTQPASKGTAHIRGGDDGSQLEANVSSYLAYLCLEYS